MDNYITATAGAVTHWLFLPTLLMVLSQQNVGVVPAPVERLMSRAPKWLRGQPLATPT